jgi:hypothetical protein
VYTDINRRFLKASYQPNMIRAQLCSIGFLVLVAVLIVVLDKAPLSVTEQYRIIQFQMPGKHGSIGETARGTVWRGPGKSMNVPLRAGFLGFTNPHPQPAVMPSVIPIPVADDESPYDKIGGGELFPNSGNGNDETGGSVFGFYGSGDDGLGLPDTDLPILLKNRPVTLIHSVQPQIPPIAKWDGREGYVEILMLVDSTGEPEYFSCGLTGSGVGSGPNLELEATSKNSGPVTLNFYVGRESNSLLYVKLKETPDEYHFADYLLQVLPEWKFAPAIRDGRPISSFVIVQYRFCYGSNPDCQRLLLKSISS